MGSETTLAMSWRRFFVTDSEIVGDYELRSAWSKVESAGWTVVESGCWEWNGGRTGQAYGAVRIGSRQVKVHRASYRHFNGPLPQGLVVRHKCDNPPCMNPDHLELGTHRDNMRDRDLRGRGVQHQGSRNPAAKITEQDVRDIRKEYARGVLTQAMLGEVYGLTQSSVGEIVLRKTWGGVK